MTEELKRWRWGYSDGVPGTPAYERAVQICNLCDTVRSRCRCDLSPPPPTEGAQIVEELLRSAASQRRSLTFDGIYPETGSLNRERAATHITTQEAELTRLRQRVAELEGAVKNRDYWKPDPEDPFWMLESADGEWLKNAHSLLGTRDATKALRFPTKRAANAHPAKMTPGYKWWHAQATEHLWVNHQPNGDAL